MSDTTLTDETRSDIEFFWDPICPFAWITSRWVTEVATQREYTVNWRLICLSLLNEDKDYASFPDGYRELHDKGRRMLRVADAVRNAHGSDATGRLYTAYGASIWNPDGGLRAPMEVVASTEHLTAALRAAELPEELVASAEEVERDQHLRASTQEALERTGSDVGTPIITFHRDGQSTSFFGPVVSSVPPAQDAVQLWDAVVTLAHWQGFAELKRSKRDDLAFPEIPGI